MSKPQHTADTPAAGAAVPENVPAHKRAYITRHGGSVVLESSTTAVHADALASVDTDHNTTAHTEGNADA